MFLIDKEEDFNRLDCLLLNYASVLSTGLDDLNCTSSRIKAALSMLCRGKLPEDELLTLLPESGYALVLSEYRREPEPSQESSGRTETFGQKDYLSYLIHHHFPHKISYSLSEDEIHMFADTEDAEGLCKRLIRMLKHTGRTFHAGISRQYSRSQAVTAFSEATHAVKMAELLDYETRPCLFHELGIYRLFSDPENDWPVNQMLGEMDDMLQSMDKDKKNTLSLTIRVFVKNNFNYQRTADKLFTHVNTIRYRIHLIEKLWNVDLSKEEGRLLFSVLAKLLPLWVKHTGQELLTKPPGEV